jgi:hypothetical protein
MAFAAIFPDAGRWPAEQTLDTGRVTRIMQVMLIFDLPWAPRPADQVHRRYTSGQPEVSGDRADLEPIGHGQAIAATPPGQRDLPPWAT